MNMPVLLVWGDQDEATPLWMGKMMEEKMPNAGLAIFEGDDHYAYWHQWDRFNRCLEFFLKEEGINCD
jgi:pimeloyl-ACP methyl ester carboxylesterase